MTQWTVSDTEGATRARDRLSRNVAATRDSMPSSGTAYAHQGTPAPAAASASVTTATPASPRPRPTHCRPETYWPSSGPARAPATRGCTPSIRAVVPLETPSWMA